MLTCVQKQKTAVPLRTRNPTRRASLCSRARIWKPNDRYTGRRTTLPAAPAQAALAWSPGPHRRRGQPDPARRFPTRQVRLPRTGDPASGPGQTRWTPIQITDSHHRAPYKQNLQKEVQEHTCYAARAYFAAAAAQRHPGLDTDTIWSLLLQKRRLCTESKRQARTSCELRVVGYQVRTNLTEQGHALESRRGRTTGSQIPVSLSPDGAHGPRRFPPPLPRLEFRQVGGQRTPLPQQISSAPVDTGR